MKIPSLAERPGDAVLLARHFVNRFGKELNTKVQSLSADALAAIDAYGWPGNVRELENRIKRAVIMADGKSVSADDLDLPGNGAMRRSGTGAQPARGARDRRPQGHPPGAEPHREQYLGRGQAARDQPSDALRPDQAISSASVTVSLRRAEFASVGQRAIVPGELCLHGDTLHGSPSISFDRRLPPRSPFRSHRWIRQRRFCPGRGTGDAALNELFERIFQEQVRTNPMLATYTGLDKGELARLKSQLDTRPDRQARPRKSRGPTSSSAGSKRSPETGLSRRCQAQPRSRDLGPQDRQRRPRAVRHLEPAEPLRHQPAGRRLFLDPGLPALRAHDRKCRRRRGLSVPPVAVRDRARQRDRGAAAAGGARLPRAGLVARPGARPDAQAARAGAWRRAIWRLRSPSRAAAKNIAGDWRGRAAKIVAEKVYPALDRQIAAVAALRPTSQAGRRHLARAERRGHLRRRAGGSDDDQLHRRRNPSARPAAGRRNHAPSSTRSCAAPAIPAAASASASPR